MSEYVAFKCSLCSTEAISLENLEGHIWNRHLGTFQYYCAECSYPALNYQALSSHFLTHHNDCQDIQFKRKITDEIKLRDIIAASLVVPLYEDEEQMYDDSNRVPEAGDMETVVTEEAGPLQELRDGEEGQLMEHLAQNGEPIIYMKEEYRGDNYLDEPGPSMIGEQEEVVISTEAADLDADDNTYPIYSGHELLGDEYQFVDEEGNAVYVTDSYPFSVYTSSAQAARRGRINMTVDIVAAGHKKLQRSTTIWPCPDCRKIIRHPSRIEAHRRMHAGEKPFACTVCAQKFASKGALKCHLRSHSGEKPYACTWDCGKTFVSASAQRMHERSHSGEKPFACQICGRLYGKRSHLVRHEQTSHMQIPNGNMEPKGLDTAGSSMELLREIVEGIVEEVQHDRVKAIAIDNE